jgi:hypothetical protein
MNGYWVKEQFGEEQQAVSAVRNKGRRNTAVANTNFPGCCHYSSTGHVGFSIPMRDGSDLIVEISAQMIAEWNEFAQRCIKSEADKLAAVEADLAPNRRG